MFANRAIQPRNPSSIYFGKIASRGDFVRSASGSRLIVLIDNWAAQGMELLIADPGWKSGYDTRGPIDFLLIGTRKRNAICGSLIPSADASSRRFPFIAATLFELGDALAFLPLSAVLLERHVHHHRALAHHASKTADAENALATLGDAMSDIAPDFELRNEGYRRFLATDTLADLSEALSLDGSETTVRRMVLAIGYLLQPVLTSYAVAPQKGLVLPLPAEPARMASVKALWLDLICTFLHRTDFELAVFTCIRNGLPALIVTFNGTTSAVFRALFNDEAARALLIDITDSAWVDAHAAQDAATYKLSSYLAHGELSLQHLVEAFRQGFSG